MSTSTVVVAFGSMDLELSRAWATQVAAQGTPVIIIAITRQAHRGCWRVALSWQGDAPTWVSAHRLKTAAEAQVARLWHVVQEGNCGDRASFTRLAQQLATYGDVALADGHAGRALRRKGM